MSKNQNRANYEAAIKAAIQGNRQALVKTLYLMYSQRVKLLDRDCATIVNQSTGFCNLAGNMTTTYWNDCRVRRLVKTLVLQIPSKKRCFSKVSWTHFPMDPITGPFNPRALEWIRDNITTISEEKVITIPDYDYSVACHIWVLDQIDTYISHVNSIS